MTTAIVAISVSDFITALDRHYTNHMYSDYASGAAYNAGVKSWNGICEMIKADPSLNDVLDAYKAFNAGRGNKPTAAQFENVAVSEVATGTTASNDDDNNPDDTDPVAMDFTRDNVIELVKTGLIFGCQFTKRTTGELRSMQARVSVKKHLKGCTAAYSAKDKNLLFVYDMANCGYRSIPIENIQSMTVRGTTYTRAQLQAA